MLHNYCNIDTVSVAHVLTVPVTKQRTIPSQDCGFHIRQPNILLNTEIQSCYIACRIGRPYIPQEVNECCYFQKTCVQLFIERTWCLMPDGKYDPQDHNLVEMN